MKVVNDVPIDLAKSVDEDGSLVTLDPADWLVCFVPGLQRQWWHRFVDRKHKHVFAMRPVGTGNWLLVEPWWTRLMVTLLRPADAIKFLRWAGTGDILRVREAIPGKASQFRGWSNCAVLTALLLGRSSRTWTPHGLYQQLLSEEETRHENLGQILLDQYTKTNNQHSADELNAAAEIFLSQAHQYSFHDSAQTSGTDDDTMPTNGSLCHLPNEPLPRYDTDIHTGWSGVGHRGPYESPRKSVASQ